jgi:uncharacterized membrane protein YsdA (DUF1294 family)
VTEPTAVAAYALAVNAAAFGAFWLDKRAAIRGDWRTPERTLLALAALGGWVGALAGQHMLRHKTRKEPFRTILYAIIGLEIAGLAAFVVMN